jgi:hypothetical protein
MARRPDSCCAQLLPLPESYAWAYTIRKPYCCIGNKYFTQSTSCCGCRSEGRNNKNGNKTSVPQKSDASCPNKSSSSSLSQDTPEKPAIYYVDMLDSEDDLRRSQIATAADL